MNLQIVEFSLLLFFCLLRLLLLFIFLFWYLLILSRWLTSLRLQSFIYFLSLSLYRQLTSLIPITLLIQNRRLLCIFSILRVLITRPNIFSASRTKRYLHLTFLFSHFILRRYPHQFDWLSNDVLFKALCWMVVLWTVVSLSSFFVISWYLLCGKLISVRWIVRERINMRVLGLSLGGIKVKISGLMNLWLFGLLFYHVHCLYCFILCFVVDLLIFAFIHRNQGVRLTQMPILLNLTFKRLLIHFWRRLRHKTYVLLKRFLSLSLSIFFLLSRSLQLSLFYQLNLFLPK